MKKRTINGAVRIKSEVAQLSKHLALCQVTHAESDTSTHQKQKEQWFKRRRQNKCPLGCIQHLQLYNNNQGLWFLLCAYRATKHKAILVPDMKSSEQKEMHGFQIANELRCTKAKLQSERRWRCHRLASQKAGRLYEEHTERK